MNIHQRYAELFGAEDQDVYAWIIDTDLLAYGGATDKGVTGPSTAPAHLLEQLAKGQGTSFRMLDDDDEVYYRGRIIVESDESGEAEFGPLTDFGTPNAGAVDIQYRQGGVWTSL